MRRIAARFHYVVLPWLLGRLPWVVWRGPALVLGTLRWLIQGEVRAASGAALAAVGRPAHQLARWRFGWLLAYHQEANFLLSLQPDKLTDAWVARRSRRDGDLPPGGAVLVAPHQLYSRFASRLLLLDGFPLGLIDGGAREAWDPTHPDYAAEVAAHGDRSAHFARRREVQARLFGPNIFSPQQVRAAARFLATGGYLVIVPDGFGNPRWERAPLLGRAISLASGPVWLARQTGKPIVPYIVIAGWRGWRIWYGEPIVPTRAALAAALSDSLRRAPLSLHGVHWHIWSQSPTWDAASD